MYISTRGQAERFSAAAAIQRGIAADGGLFVPEALPMFTQEDIAALADMTYQQRAARILGCFLDDYSSEQIERCIAAAYNEEKFDTEAIAPLAKVGEDNYVLELWHGPTSAFKDMALQLLPQLLSTALTITGEQKEIVILVATSGDTGKAALAGFQDVDQIRIIVFYPHEGVSAIQRLQMVTQEGANTAVIAVTGNFDDAQTGVKKIFGDTAFNAALAAEGFQLSSANSINWGRLVPQIVYYFSAYADMLKEEAIMPGQAVNFVVPTGNFGNILAGYYAKCMGLPVNKLICASNSNNVLTDFLQTGVYDRKREFFKTLSPSMDILISSNLERLLYHITGGNTAQVSAWMNELATTGEYRVEGQYFADIKQLFWADWSDDQATAAVMQEVFAQYSYVVDPHTAVAWQAAERYHEQTGDHTPTIVVSTASPFKFNDSVLAAIATDFAADASEFSMLRQLSEVSKWPIPQPLAALEDKAVLHTTVCAKDEMLSTVKAVLEDR